MRQVMYDFYMHWGMWITCIIFLNVQMAVDPEVIGEIRANVKNLCEQMGKLAEGFAEMVKGNAKQETIVAVLLERVSQHDDRLDMHEGQIKEVVATVGKIEAVVFPKSRGSVAQGNPSLTSDAPADGSDQDRVSMPRWLIVLIVVISAIAGDVLLQYVVPTLLKP